MSVQNLRSGRRLGFSREAFTLVEMLVVISLIALLIAMLLPALASAKEASRVVKCLSHERQIAVALHVYAQENAEWLAIGAYPSSGTHYSPTWAAVVAHWGNNPYTTEVLWNDIAYAPGYGCTGFEEAKWRGYANTPKKSQGILKCPSDQLLDAWGSDLAVSYGWNQAQYGLGVSDTFTYRDAGYPDPIWGEYYGRVRTSKLIHPGTTIMVADQYWPGIYEYAILYTLRLADPATGVTNHAGKLSNILYTDGHAVTRKAAEVPAGDFDRRY